MKPVLLFIWILLILLFPPAEKGAQLAVIPPWLIPLLITAGGSAASAIFGKSKDVNPEAVEATWPWMAETLGDWLFSDFSQKEDGGWEMAGVPPYPGDLNTDVGGTRLPEAWKSWQPWDAGTQHMAQLLQSGLSEDPRATKAFDNMTQYGGIGGWPTELMHSMAQFGGTGGPGHTGLANAAQFGVPNPAVGQYATNIAKTGVSSPGAGGPLRDRALGNPTAASSYLMPFLTGQQPVNYNIPNIQPRSLTRRN